MARNVFKYFFFDSAADCLTPTKFVELYALLGDGGASLTCEALAEEDKVLTKS